MKSTMKVCTLLIALLAMACDESTPGPDAGTDGSTAGTQEIVATIGGTERTFQLQGIVVNPPGVGYTAWAAQQSDSVTMRTLQVTFPGEEPGSFDCGDGDGNLIRVQLSELDNTARNGDSRNGGACSIEVTEVGPAPDGLVRGTFTATLPYNGGTFAITAGRFTIRRQDAP